MTPYRSRPYLDLVYLDGVRCAKCGAQASGFMQTDPAHYSGLFSDRLGKGGAQKCADIVSCPLCRKCHTDFDLYRTGNDEKRAAEFLLLCWEWLLCNLDAGRVELVVHSHPVQRPAPRERVAGRRKPSRCTAAANQVKRNPERLA